MYRVRFIFLIHLLISPLCLYSQVADADDQVIRIGIVPDHPPFLMLNERGEPDGFHVELYTRIVEEFGYKPEFIVTDFYNIQSGLLNNEIDMFPALIRQPERENIFYWPEEPSAIGWGQLFVRNSTQLESILDLQYKKIAIVKDEAMGRYFGGYMESLGITVETVVYDNADSMIEAVVSGEAYGGVAHNTLLLGNRRIKGTEVIFEPSSAYATCSATNFRMIPLVDQFSSRLSELKNDPGSYYWTLYTRWTSPEYSLQEVLPRWFWIPVSAVILLVVLLVFFSWFLKLKVNRATRELQLLNESLEEKVSRRTADLEKAAARLADSEKASITMRLVGGIAHEINTPIGVAVTAVSHLENEVDKLKEAYSRDELTSENFETFLNESAEVLSMTSGNLKRSVELITNFRDVNSDQSMKQKREIELNTYIRGIVKSVQPQFKNTGIRIHLNLAEKSVLTYPDVLIHILLNLMLNSLTHGFRGRKDGDIYITAREQKGHVTIIHSDSGRGIGKEAAEHIFEPFYTSNREEGNTGLGLSIVYNLVQDILKGTIEMDSRPGVFTKFTIEYDLNPK